MHVSACRRVHVRKDAAQHVTFVIQNKARAWCWIIYEHVRYFTNSLACLSADFSFSSAFSLSCPYWTPSLYFPFSSFIVSSKQQKRAFTKCNYCAMSLNSDHATLTSTSATSTTLKSCFIHQEVGLALAEGKLHHTHYLQMKFNSAHSTCTASPTDVSATHFYFPKRPTVHVALHCICRNNWIRMRANECYSHSLLYRYKTIYCIVHNGIRIKPPLNGNHQGGWIGINRWTWRNGTEPADDLNTWSTVNCSLV